MHSNNFVQPILKQLQTRLGGIFSLANKLNPQSKIIKTGPALRVIFYYPGEEGTYMENVNVTVYDTGAVHIESKTEESTAHLQNCEIIWRFDLGKEPQTDKIRLIRPKSKKETDLPLEQNRETE